MGNCCCVLRNGDKKFKSSQKPGHKRTFYKYGDDEYDNDDYDQDTLDYDRQTTKSDLSSQIRPKYEQKRPRSNRLLEKAIINQHHQKNHQLCSSSTILLLKQSHLIQPSNLEKKFNSDLASKISDLKQESKTVLRNHSESYNLALNKINALSSTNNICKRWSLFSNDLIDSIGSSRVSEDNAKHLLRELSDVDDGVDMGDDALDNVSDSQNQDQDSIKDGLTDNNSSSDQLIVNSISSTVITTSKSSYADATPKLIQSCHSMKSSMEDLTSNSNLDEYESNKKRLVYQKRNSNLNHSLNESDLIINGRVGKKRKLKQRKIDLMDDPLNNSYHEDDEYNINEFEENKLKKNYVNYRSLQKSKRSIKSIEQTIKNSKSIEKWLNDLDKIKELESSLYTFQRSDSIPNQELYSLLEDCEDQTKKLTDSLPKNLHDCILNLIELNSNQSIRCKETEMLNFIKKFVFPKSLANAEDINYLKHLLSENNFSLFIEQPLLNNLGSNYILDCKNINVNLVENSNELEINMEDQLYLKYLNEKQVLLLDQDKVKYIIKKEKELSQATNLNNQGVLESFREKYINTSNFRVVQSLLEICKKSSYSKNLCNSSSSSSASSTPIVNTSDFESNPIAINFADLNDKLFLCFLSNFSCKLVENFLYITNNLNQSQLNLNSAGFIRKHKFDNSFSYITNESEFKFSNFKLYLKLSQWPSNYDFLTRIKFIKCKHLIEYIRNNTCLITNKSNKDELDMSYDESSAEKWTIDTKLAETVIFKAFNSHHTFMYYYLYIILNNLKCIIQETNSITKQRDDTFVGSRVLLHHFLRFIDSKNQPLNLEPVRFYLDFCSFLKTSIGNYGSLNRPSFFDLKQEILDARTVDSKLNEFVDLLNISELYFNKCSKPIDLGIQFKLSIPRNSNKIFNEYLTDFFQILFDQFKSKRDHFKMNEQVLIEIHDKVLRCNENLNLLLANQETHIDISAALLSKFEFYAECVHKYLPQIRQQNQYLLFHYIWTMQVQYFAPFFNYICDLYKSYN